jgi:hypothetical protein
LPNEIEEDQAQWARVKRHFRKCADKVIKDAMYNARIAAVNYYYKKIKGQKMSKSLWIGLRRTWKPRGGWLRDGRRLSGLQSPRSTVPTVALKV